MTGDIPGMITRLKKKKARQKTKKKNNEEPEQEGVPAKDSNGDNLSRLTTKFHTVSQGRGEGKEKEGNIGVFLCLVGWNGREVEGDQRYFLPLLDQHFVSSQMQGI